MACSEHHKFDAYANVLYQPFRFSDFIKADRIDVVVARANVSATRFQVISAI